MNGFKWPWVSRARYDALNNDLDIATNRLHRIIALETPKCAHGVRRAVKIAKGEL